MGPWRTSKLEKKPPLFKRGNLTFQNNRYISSLFSFFCVIFSQMNWDSNPDPADPKTMPIHTDPDLLHYPVVFSKADNLDPDPRVRPDSTPSSPPPPPIIPIFPALRNGLNDLIVIRNMIQIWRSTGTVLFTCCQDGDSETGRRRTSWATCDTPHLGRKRRHSKSASRLIEKMRENTCISGVFALAEEIVWVLLADSAMLTRIRGTSTRKEDKIK